MLENGYDEKHIVCINFDGEEFKEYRHSRDAYNLIKSKINDKEEFCILLDDVQYVDDFVVEQGHRKYYIQSALEMSTEEKREQEYQSLRLIDDSFKKFVIRYDNNATYINDYGIINLGLFDFLLKEDCFSFD